MQLTHALKQIYFQEDNNTQAQRTQMLYAVQADVVHQFTSQ